jgi:hypothetical protein
VCDLKGGLVALLKLCLYCLLALLQAHLSLKTHGWLAFAAPLELVVCEGIGEVVAQGSECVLVLLAHLGECHAGGGLLANKGSYASTALYNAVRNTHLAAESRHPNNELDWVNIRSNYNKLCLLLLNQSSNVLQTELEHVWWSTSITTLLSSSSKALSFLLLGLRGVLGEQLEEFYSLVLLYGVSELVHCRRNAQTLVQDLLLALDANVLWPLYEATQVLLDLLYVKNLK